MSTFVNTTDSVIVENTSSYNDCFIFNTSADPTINGTGSLSTVPSTWLGSTASTLVFNNLTNCSAMDNNQAAPSDSTNYRDYWEYWVAFYINRYNIYFIAGLGIPGNIAALITIYHMKPFVSWSVYTTFLACSDGTYLMIRMFYFQATSRDIQLYHFGCKVIHFFGTFFMHFSDWIIAIMTIERFIAIWFPFKVSQLCTNKRTLMNVGVLAFLLAALNLHFFWTIYEGFHPKYKYMCMFYKSVSHFIYKIWYVIDMSVYGFLPLLVIMVFNVLIAIGIRKSARKKKVLTNQVSKDKIKQQKQITVMSFTVSIVFLVLTLPNCFIFVYQEYWDYKTSKHEEAQHYLFYNVAVLLSDLNFAVNFYLYFVSGKKFRDRFKAIFCCSNGKCIRRQTKKKETTPPKIDNGKVSGSPGNPSDDPKATPQTPSSIATVSSNDTTETSANSSTLSLNDVVIDPITKF